MNQVITRARQVSNVSVCQAQVFESAIGTQGKAGREAQGCCKEDCEASEG